MEQQLLTELVPVNCQVPACRWKSVIGFGKAHFQGGSVLVGSPWVPESRRADSRLPLQLTEIGSSSESH
ncbi:hypothetical protein [Burkholderia sp. PR2]|uniref:hypothetical protein n=1 Tax=Burkholderia sp. PR2 TaxID=3448078 RepID=UPI00402AA81A